MRNEISTESDGYYISAESDGFVALRQCRYRDQLNRGREHPHDVCAIARGIDELRDMLRKYIPDAADLPVENVARSFSPSARTAANPHGRHD